VLLLLQVDRLKMSLGVTTDVTSRADLQALQDALHENESLMAELNMTWEEKLEAANKCVVAATSVALRHFSPLLLLVLSQFVLLPLESV